MLGSLGKAEPAKCHYEYTVWNVKEKRSVERRKVAKPYRDLTRAEKSPEGCTPCEEDQELVTLSNQLQFRACKILASKFKAALEAALSQGETIKSVVGYRSQVSRGPVDAKGNRTELSNHAFGVALDINEDFNGLYSQCHRWSPKCVLVKGGKYSPGSPLSLVKSGPIVQELVRAGFRWGGEIAGQQKDFMHFSPSGY